MRTIWNILFPITILTAGTYNSLRPAMATVGTQTWAVGLFSLKALRHTTKIPKYSWYGLQLLLLAPLRLINVKSGKKNNKNKQNRLKRQSRNGIFQVEEGAVMNLDDEDEDGEQNDSEDEETHSFMKTTVSDGVVTTQLGLASTFPRSSNPECVVIEDAVEEPLLTQKQQPMRGRRRGCLLVLRRPTQHPFVTMYRTIPLRFMSRIWGRLMKINLPKPLRKPIIHIYATVYGCNLAEISMDDVSGYTCLGEFFRRRLRPEVRPIETSAPLTSPADGTIVRSGLVQDSKLEQIKGVTYSLADFLGAISWRTPAPPAPPTPTPPEQTAPPPNYSTPFIEPALSSQPAPSAQSACCSHSTPLSRSASKSNLPSKEQTFLEDQNVEDDEDPEAGRLLRVTSTSPDSTIHSPHPHHPSSAPSTCAAPLPVSAPLPVDADVEYQRRLCVNDPETHKLHHLVVYLAPGDYHRFHSPADWTVTFRRHFPGDLFSVAPLISRLISGLFNYNERVLYSGFWEHGFFSLTAVGATGVGSIHAHLDPALSTNEYKWNPRKENHQDLDFEKDFPGGIRVSKGEEFGEFNLGSTIVLIFEAPNDFQFSFDDTAKIKVGQAVGSVRRRQGEEEERKEGEEEEGEEEAEE